jgi:hypothetical protein
VAITQGICTSFKKELLEAKHDFSATGGHTFYMALYTSSASLGVATTDYSATNETSGTGYVAGGQALSSNGTATSGTTAYVDFADETWATASFTARGAVIYNTTTGGGTSTTESVQVLDFGSDKTATAQDFTVTFPTAAATTAIIQIR